MKNYCTTVVCPNKLVRFAHWLTFHVQKILGTFWFEDAKIGLIQFYLIDIYINKTEDVDVNEVVAPNGYNKIRDIDFYIKTFLMNEI